MLHQAPISRDSEHLSSEHAEVRSSALASALVLRSILSSRDIDTCVSEWESDNGTDTFDEYVCGYAAFHHGIPFNIFESYLLQEVQLHELTQRIQEHQEAPEIPQIRQFLHSVDKKYTLCDTMPSAPHGVVGKGGMGMVVLVTDPFGVPRALKIPTTKESGHLDQQGYDLDLARQVREIFIGQRLGTIDPEHFPRVIDYNFRDASSGEVTELLRQRGFYHVMEYLDGMDLEEMVKERKAKEGAALSHREVAHMVHEAALGLANIHQFGFIHRDIKPSNLHFGRTVTMHNELAESSQPPHLRILDSGLARFDPAAHPGNQQLLQNMGRVKDIIGENGAELPLPEQPKSTVTQKGQVLGTPAYMPSEQMDPARFSECDERTDAFALMQTMYYLLTGKVPRHGTIKDLPSGTNKYLLRAYKRASCLDQEKRATVADILPDLQKALESYEHPVMNRRNALRAAAGLLMLAGTGGYFAARRGVDEEKNANGSSNGTMEVKPENGGEGEPVVPEAVPDKWPPDVLDLSAVGLESIDFKGGENAYQQMEGGTVWFIFDSAKTGALPKYYVFISNKKDNFVIYTNGDVVLRNGSDSFIKYFELQRDKGGAMASLSLQPRLTDPGMLEIYEQFGETIGEPIIPQSIIEGWKRAKQPPSISRLLYVFACDMRIVEGMQGRKLQNRPEWIDKMVLKNREK